MKPVHQLRSCCLVLSLAALSASPPCAAQPGDGSLLDRLTSIEQQRIAVIAKASAATIAVFGQDGSGGGSGVLITPEGFALTNFHVVAPCGNAMRCGLPDGVLYDAVIVGVDPTGDVALIKLLGRDDFPTAPLGDSDELLVGQACFAAGNPFLLATDFQPTITWGIISGIHRYQYPSKTLLEYADCIQTDAAINPGNSGGPLFDVHGSVIGINGRISIEKRGRVNVGVGYAISINQIKKFLGHLHSGRIVDHATLGFTVSSAPDEEVVVTNILESSDAYRRGIRIDDVIVALDNRVVTTANELKNVLGTFPKGWRVPLTVRRGRDEFTVNVRLAGLHAEEELLQLMEQPGLESPTPRPKPGAPEPPEGPPKHPRPRPPRATAKDGQHDLPAEIQKVFESRRGFANYYFNRLHVQTIHQQLVNQFSGESDDTPWSVGGGLETGGQFQLRLGKQSSDLELPSGTWTLSTEQPLDAQLVPNGSGGFLVALHLLHEFVTHPADTFGEVKYVGTTPLSGYKELVDLTVCLREALELRLYTHPASGHLLAVELSADSRQDPCEIYLRYGQDQAVPLPVALEVRRGEDVFAVLKVERFANGSVQ